MKHQISKGFNKLGRTSVPRRFSPNNVTSAPTCAFNVQNIADSQDILGDTVSTVTSLMTWTRAKADLV